MPEDSGRDMRQDNITHRKVVVVGAGAVGATFAYSLAQSGLTEDIVLVDQNRDLLRGQVLDLLHGQPFFPAVSIREGSSRDYTDAHLIVVTAGRAQQKGETRLQLLRNNAVIMRQIMDHVIARQSRAVILVVTNPVDVMTWVALQHSGWERGRVIGSGTVLDSARLRYLLADRCRVDVHNVHAYVLGEHGDSEFVAWSMSHVAGTPVAQWIADDDDSTGWPQEQQQIQQQVRDSAYHIIGYKGSTSFAVGLALVRICAAVLRDQRSVLTVSVQLQGEFGLDGVCMSVPCVVGARGVLGIAEHSLSVEEQFAMQQSASALGKAVQALTG